MSLPALYMDVASKSVNYSGERICGDSVILRRLYGGGRTLVVLSDGMGHGVKANVLSTLTSSMLANLLRSGRPVTQIAAMILRTLPVCSIRKISYSTFTVLDMDAITGRVSIVEYDNPRAIVLRGGEPLAIEWQQVEALSSEGRRQTIRTASFDAHEGDRIAVVSDGVTQSGQKSGKYRFGWGEEHLREFVSYLTTYNSAISAFDLAAQVISKASINDAHAPSDDMTCVSVCVRRPRTTMFISCPPAMREDHARLAAHIGAFEGKKIISGYHVAEIIAGEMGLGIERQQRSSDPALPPAWNIAGFDQVTDGLITSNRVLNSLESGQRPAGRNAADRLTRTLLDSDRIEMVIGTMRSPERGQWQAGEFELRRSILERIASLLGDKYGKQVALTYI